MERGQQGVEQYNYVNITNTPWVDVTLMRMGNDKNRRAAYQDGGWNYYVGSNQPALPGPR